MNGISGKRAPFVQNARQRLEQRQVAQRYIRQPVPFSSPLIPQPDHEGRIYCHLFSTPGTVSNVFVHVAEMRPKNVTVSLIWRKDDRDVDQKVRVKKGMNEFHEKYRVRPGDRLEVRVLALEVDKPTEPENGARPPEALIADIMVGFSFLAGAE